MPNSFYIKDIKELPAMSDLTAARFKNKDAARRHLERIRWPDGPVCPHCRVMDRASRIKGGRKGLLFCNACRKQYSVTVGTIFERSHVPLHKWLLANHLMVSSKEGISVHQLHRMLGVTYKTAWFMAHRIREAMREPNPRPLGGGNKVVESDETYIGGKAENRAYAPPPPKEAMFALVERDGGGRGFHVKDVNAKTLRPVMVTQIDRVSYLKTDEATYSKKPGKEFAGHGTVNHSIKEYLRGGFWHTNTAENYFSILKRGINGVYQHCGAKHLERYVGEFDFRYDTRLIGDAERAA